MKMSVRHVFKTSSRHVFKACLQIIWRQSSRRLWDIFSVTFFVIPSHFQNVFEMPLQSMKMPWKTKDSYAEDMLRCLHNVLKTNKPLRREELYQCFNDSFIHFLGVEERDIYKILSHLKISTKVIGCN